jgi:hypothetical protein
MQMDSHQNISRTSLINNHQLSQLIRKESEILRVLISILVSQNLHNTYQKIGLSTMKNLSISKKLREIEPVI